jgi:hypothetical protein
MIVGFVVLFLSDGAKLANKSCRVAIRNDFSAVRFDRHRADHGRLAGQASRPAERGKPAM